MVFRGQAEKDFEVDASSSPEMDLIISNCADIYRGFPNWVSVDDNVKTINFAKTICSELARLTTLAIGIQIDGSVRGEWLQEQIDSIYFQIRHWVEYGCAYGTIFVKPNSKGFDIFTPSDVLLVDYDNQDIRGIIFKDTYTEGKKYYTRLEYHRFVEISQDGTALIL